MYADYYNTCKHPNSPAIRDANPVVILYRGIGMFTFAKDKQTARVAAEFYINAINAELQKIIKNTTNYSVLKVFIFDIQNFNLE